MYLFHYPRVFTSLMFRSWLTPRRIDNTTPPPFKQWWWAQCSLASSVFLLVFFVFNFFRPQRSIRRSLIATFLIYYIQCPLFVFYPPIPLEVPSHIHSSAPRPVLEPGVSDTGSETQRTRHKRLVSTGLITARTVGGGGNIKQQPNELMLFSIVLFATVVLWILVIHLFTLDYYNAIHWVVKGIVGTTRADEQKSWLLSIEHYYEVRVMDILLPLFFHSFGSPPRIPALSPMRLPKIDDAKKQAWAWSLKLDSVSLRLCCVACSIFWFLWLHANLSRVRRNQSSSLLGNVGLLASQSRRPRHQGL